MLVIPGLIAIVGFVLRSEQAWTWVSLFLAALVVVQAYVGVRWWSSRPQLELDAEVTGIVSIGSPEAIGTTGSGRFVRILVRNEGEGDARDLHASLDFRSTDGEPLFENPFPARWAGTEQPVLRGRFAHIGRELSEIMLPANGRPEGLDVIVRFQDDPGVGSGCYVWSNDSMLAGVRRDEYRVEAEQFDVVVTLRGSNRVEASGTWRVRPRLVPEVVRVDTRPA